MIRPWLSTTIRECNRRVFGKPDDVLTVSESDNVHECADVIGGDAQ